MPTLGSQQLHTSEAIRARTGHPCSNCHERLQLVRRHVSPHRLGAPSVTEFYQCIACDSGFAFSASTGRWKPWVTDD